MAVWRASYPLILLLALELRVEGNSNLLIETTTGLIKGTITSTFTQKEARAFYGIPYAEPPVGKLRFRTPVPVKAWTGVFDASHGSPPCYQMYTRESLRLSKRLEKTVRRPWSEDCLTLNIWAPSFTPHEAPVRIFIHDGGFTTGTGSYPFFDLSTTAVEAELICATLNYRLGAFGFLSLGVPEFSGNLGLMDQQVALKWLRKNVEKFGGKSEAIFLTGSEAGAASIGHQIIQSENEGLFKTGILIDGAPTCSWAWQTKKKAVGLAKHLSQSLGCNHSNLEDEIECLQKVHPEEILDASLLDRNSESEGFKPNIDETFIKEVPSEAMKAGRFNNMTVINLVTTKARSVDFLNQKEDILSGPEPSLTEEGFREAIRRVNLARTDVEENVISDWYLRRDSPMNGTVIRDAAVDVYTDGLSTCCGDEFLNYATQGGVLTYKVVTSFPDPKFPAWIGSHTMMLHSLHVSDTVNPKHKYEPRIRMMTTSAWHMTKTYLRKKAREFQEVVPLYNMTDQPYMFWDGVQAPRFQKRQRTEECALWTQILPLLRSKKNAC